MRDVAGRDRYEIGEYTTPALVADLMLELANPVPGERVYDPCFGFGGLLLGIAQRLHAAARTDSFGVWGDIHRTGIFGIEVDRVSYGIGLCRTLLAGIERPGLAFGDALDRALPDSRSNDGFDCILAAPPWGRKASHRHAGPQPVFERRGGETDEPGASRTDSLRFRAVIRRTSFCSMRWRICALAGEPSLPCATARFTFPARIGR